MELGCILLIDDDGATNYVNKLIIKRSSVAGEVLVANDGVEGLNLISSEPPAKVQSPKKNLVFLDINMPRMDGWEFMEEYNKLSEEDRSRNEIYILSTTINPMDRFKANEVHGLKGFLVKPLTEDIVKGIVAAA